MLHGVDGCWQETYAPMPPHSSECSSTALPTVGCNGSGRLPRTSPLPHARIGGYSGLVKAELAVHRGGMPAWTRAYSLQLLLANKGRASQ